MNVTFPSCVNRSRNVSSIQGPSIFLKSGQGVINHNAVGNNLFTSVNMKKEIEAGKEVSQIYDTPMIRREIPQSGNVNFSKSWLG